VHICALCTSIRYYVGFEHVAELIKKRKCKFTNNLVACHFDFEVLQLSFTELFAFAMHLDLDVCVVLSFCLSF